MTNLLTTSSQPWLTRGRLLVGLPLGLGVLVSAAVVVLGVRPLLQTVQGLEERRDTLLSLQRSAPVLERQLNQAETELRMAEEKQALLVGLLAGRDKVQTFLALLNQQAVASGVQMLRYEPLKTPSPQQGQSRQNIRRSNAKQKAEPPQDSLQALGYRKSSVALEVSGSFGGLQTFLQRMEALELLVESSELEIKVVVEKKDDEPAQAAVARTQLTLKLSFYDLAPKAGPPAEASTSTPS
jgi:type IV pilus assembly protein PilO